MYLHNDLFEGQKCHTGADCNGWEGCVCVCVCVCVCLGGVDVIQLNTLLHYSTSHKQHDATGVLCSSVCVQIQACTCTCTSERDSTCTHVFPHEHLCALGSHVFLLTLMHCCGTESFHLSLIALLNWCLHLVHKMTPSVQAYLACAGVWGLHLLLTGKWIWHNLH